MESYRTLREGAEATGEFEDRRSRFIAQLVHAASEKDAAAHVAAVRARHYDARHNVPAGSSQTVRSGRATTASPSARAACPPSRCCGGAGLKDVCCVTTRYFGGTLLGPGGLVRAYTAAAQAAVAAAGDAGLIVEMTSVVPIALDVTYAQYDQVRDVVERTGGRWRTPPSPTQSASRLCTGRGRRPRFSRRCASASTPRSALRWGLAASPSFSDHLVLR